MGYSPHSHKESDMAETTEHSRPSGTLGLPKLIRQLGLRRVAAGLPPYYPRCSHLLMAGWWPGWSRV